MKPSDITAVVDAAKAELIDRFLRTPHDFFTENDITAFFAHRLHVGLHQTEPDHMLVHLEYPTPFRCDMSNGRFALKGEEELTARGRRYQRGHYDVVIFDPCFFDECRDNYPLRKGQKWELLRPFLLKRPEAASPAALHVFELMFLRDPFWRREDIERGTKTLSDVVVAVEQDCAKAMAATRRDTLGYQFSRSAEMLIFDSALGRHAAEELRRRMPPGAELISRAV